MSFSSKLFVSALALAFSLPGFAGSAFAQSESNRRDPLKAGYIYTFDANIDGGGKISSHFLNTSATVPIYIEEGRFVGLSGGYRLNAYDFSGGGPGSFAALDPWDQIHTIQLSLPIRWDLGGDWSFFGLPNIRFVGEGGADFGDSIKGGALAGFSYRFGDRLTLGPGVGYRSSTTMISGTNSNMPSM